MAVKKLPSPVGEDKPTIVPLKGRINGKIDWGRGADELIRRAPQFAGHLEEALKLADPVTYILEEVFFPDYDDDITVTTDARVLARVFLTNSPQHKIPVIKAMRTATEMSLRDSKFLVDEVLRALKTEWEDKGQYLGTVVTEIMIPYLGEYPVVKNASLLREARATIRFQAQAIEQSQERYLDISSLNYQQGEEIRALKNENREVLRKLDEKCAAYRSARRSNDYDMQRTGAVEKQLWGMKELIKLVQPRLAAGKGEREQIARMLLHEMNDLKSEFSFMEDEAAKAYRLAEENDDPFVKFTL